MSIKCSGYFLEEFDYKEKIDLKKILPESTQDSVERNLADELDVLDRLDHLDR